MKDKCFISLRWQWPVFCPELTNLYKFEPRRRHATGPHANQSVFGFCCSSSTET